MARNASPESFTHGIRFINRFRLDSPHKANTETRSAEQARDRQPQGQPAARHEQPPNQAHIQRPAPPMDALLQNSFFSRARNRRRRGWTAEGNAPIHT